MSPDSVLTGEDSGRLVVLLGWSSDSLARTSRPYGGIVEMSSLRTQVLTKANIATVDSVSLPVTDSSAAFVMKVRSIGAQPVQDTVVVRHGYVDTTRVYLQSGGTIFCA